MSGYPEGVQVIITYKAFAEFITPEDEGVSPVTFIRVDWLEGAGLSDDHVLERVFHDTNTYSGSLWDQIKDRLPERRTHTAVSVGDEVQVNGRDYVCKPVGWEFIPPAHTFVG